MDIMEIDIERRRRERLRSSLRLFLDACEFWGETFDNGELIEQLKEMADNIRHVELRECSEQAVYEIEEATTELISNMDQALKSLGSPGIHYHGIKH